MANEIFLTITESEDGTLTGYQSDKKVGGTFRKVFETQSENLFHMLLGYGKGEAFNVRMLGLEDSRKFMEKQEEAPILIWRRNVTSFMNFGREPKRIGIWLSGDLTKNQYGIEKVKLHKGFRAIVIPTGKAAGVYELESGGLIGDTVEQVNEDIDACDDIELMKEQIARCIKERDSGVCNVSLGDFGIDLQYRR